MPSLRFPLPRPPEVCAEYLVSLPAEVRESLPPGLMEADSTTGTARLARTDVAGRARNGQGWVKGGRHVSSLGGGLGSTARLAVIGCQPYATALMRACRTRR